MFRWNRESNDSFIVMARRSDISQNHMQPDNSFHKIDMFLVVEFMLLNIIFNDNLR